MELTQLMQFKAIAESGTITRAAEILHISQPALSMMLRKLEGELEVPLFIRNHNRLSLTPAGEVVLSHVNVISNQLTLIKEDTMRLKRADYCISASFCSKGLMWYFIPIISEKYPDYRLEVGGFQEGNEDVASLLNNRVDVLITSRELHGPGIACVPFLTDQHFLSVPRNNPLAQYAVNGLDKESLHHVHEILYLNQNQDSFCQMFLEFLEQRYPNIKLIIYSDYFLFSQKTKSSNLPAITTRLVMRFRNDGPDYVPVALNIPELCIKYYLCYKKDNHKRVRPFLNWPQYTD